VATTDRFGNANNAYQFDGATTYMQIKSSSSLNPTAITVSAIVKFNGFNQGPNYSNAIVAKGYRDQSQGVWGMRVFPPQTNCCVIGDTAKEYLTAFYGDYGVNVGVTDTTVIRSGKWWSFVMTYDGFQLKIYIDGTLRSSIIKTAVFTPYTDDMFIGRMEYPSFPYWFKGSIDDVRVYNRPLGPGAIAQLYKIKN
ncbi:MAG: LamG domain-containing protein, partial [Bacteroidetes bacterium]|nr:LamG domain-containing protein [Bacteroidota bacterium]